MTYIITYSKKFQKSLSHFSEKDQQRITTACSFLAEDPYIGKKLGGNFSGIYSLRVWPYRVLYRIFKDVIEVYIEEVYHRKDAYK